MKTAGFLCLVVGFLIGSFFLVNVPDAVQWGYYAPCASLMLVGLILSWKARAAERGQADVHHARIEVLESALHNLAAKLQAINAEKESLFVYRVHERLDQDLLEDIGRFVDDREALIHARGMQAYADVMSVFAGSERLINRAWSASVDGYIDEVWSCLGRAEAEILRAKEMLASGRAA